MNLFINISRGSVLMRAFFIVPLVIALALVVVFSPSASACCDPLSPFREGEGYADKAATCEDVSYWAEHAPQTDHRVSMTVRGKLSAVIWTGALAYLEMCDPKGMQVVCVTYQTNGMKAGDLVSFGGGYQRRSDKWVMLDPCLAHRD